ncbi:RNA recognition domain-containing protein [Colletotrichum salicis]|uniref:RNA recognition domain-containing protein n=1 Tax=Colletotrichum salicis TaxID=1209931 RepID=A0A135UGS5_9PEZI|nr:RNA recognition domain-containing protein [Colletotrichum salicis]
MASGLPVATVYVRNLEERAKVDQLKEALHQIFSDYGNVIDIVAKTNLKAKGQAFVVFDDPEAARKAIEEVQGFELFEKPMQLALARTRSDATVKSVGNDDEFELHKRRRLAEKGISIPRLLYLSSLPRHRTLADASLSPTDKKKAFEAAEEQKRLKRPGPGGAAATDARPVKAARGTGLKSTNPSTTAVIPDEYLPPNKILFVQNLPDDYDIEAVTSIFGRFEGFREVRLVPGRRGIAFVEYEGEQGAITAKENTAGMVLGDTHTIKVTYQRQ